nr:MAG TPA: minor structural protein [Caudoviricetes sp.]
MTRKQLEDLGLTKEQADSVMKINGDDIENAKGTAATEIKNLQTEVEGLKTQVGDRDKQLETLKASAGDNADLKKQIEDLQTENATAKAAHESELNQLKIDFAVEKALTGAKAKNIKAVKALLELGEAKLDKDGNVKGLDEQIEKLRSGDDTKFLFEAQKQTKQQQNFKGFQPGASGEQKPGEGEKVDFSKMSYDELTAYMEANPDAQI